MGRQAVTRLPRAVDGVSHIVQDRAGFQQDGFTARRQSGRTGIAIDQLDPDLALEIAHLPRERGLRDVELPGGAHESARLGDGDEIPEMPQLHTARLGRCGSAGTHVLAARASAEPARHEFRYIKVLAAGIGLSLLIIMWHR